MILKTILVAMIPLTIALQETQEFKLPSLGINSDLITISGFSSGSY